MYSYIFCFFFFFKQKTAYEMRISDWSSDVCSSDLEVVDACLAMIDRQLEGGTPLSIEELMQIVPAPDFPTGAMILGQGGARNAYTTGRGSIMMRATHAIEDGRGDRSEEHTSELQSLMRISYAVFCLKKKTSRHK